MVRVVVVLLVEPALEWKVVSLSKNIPKLDWWLDESSESSWIKIARFFPYYVLLQECLLWGVWGNNGGKLTELGGGGMKIFEFSIICKVIPLNCFARPEAEKLVSIHLEIRNAKHFENAQILTKYNCRDVSKHLFNSPSNKTKRWLSYGRKLSSNPQVCPFKPNLYQQSDETRKASG